ncbi:MAG: hypothetical protein AAGG57_00145 [Pseudomonadota bacterium]
MASPAYALGGTFFVSAFCIVLTGVPLVAQTAFVVTTARLDAYIGTIKVDFMRGGFIAGRFGRRLEPTTVVISGRMVACAGLVGGLALLALGVTSPYFAFASTIFVGLANGITMPGSTTSPCRFGPF